MDLAKQLLITKAQEKLQMIPSLDDAQQRIKGFSFRVQHLRLDLWVI